MKKQHLLTACFIAALCAVPSSGAFSQSGTKYATGGNNLSIGDKFGSNNYADLAFYTNSIQRAVLTKDGRFGIGITAPSVLFQVTGGDALFEQNIEVSNLLTAGSLLVNGFTTLNGTVSIGSHLTIDGTASTITSTSGQIGFGASDLNTTGNITADTINGNVLNINTISTNNIVTNNITASGQVQAGSLEVSGNSQLGDVNAQHVQATGLTVNGDAQITGLTNTEALQATSLQVSGNTQLGNVQADTVSANYLSANGITTGNINSNQYLLNGTPLTSTQWTDTGSGIYYTGNVGIGTTVPSFPLEVQGNAAITGTLFVDRLAAQTSITIGQFRFTNGATTPGAADSIITPARLVVEAQGSISYETDTVRMGNVRFVSTQYETRLTAEKALLVEAEALTFRSSAEKVLLDADTVIAKERVGIGRSPEVALDVVGDIRASGMIDAGTGITFPDGTVQTTSSETIWQPSGTNVVHTTRNVGIGTNTPTEELEVIGNVSVSGLLKVGTSSIIIDGSQTGGTGNEPNHIYVDQGNLNLYINSADNSFSPTPSSVANTILNANDNNGNVGIGTTTPGRLLHLESTDPVIKLRNSGANGWWEIQANAFTANTFGIVRYETGGAQATKSLVIKSDGNVGIGTASPDLYSKVHILRDFPSSEFFQARNGMYIETPFLNHKGTVNAFKATGAVNYTSIIGSYETYIGRVSAFFATGSIIGGVMSRINIDDITAVDNTKTSIGTGATCVANLNNLTIGGQMSNYGSSYVGGIYTEIQGSVSQYPVIGHGAIAAVIAIDNIKGTNGSGNYTYAGYFDGKGYFSGRVNIGSAPDNPGIHNDYKLSVEGKIICKESVVKVSVWSDDVFKEGYEMLDLDEEEVFTTDRKHLPGVPSEEEVLENGVNLGEMDAILLRKIEEGRVHIYKMNKEIELLRETIALLQKEMENMKNK